MTETTLAEALPDLSLRECMERWGIRSTNAVKSRAASLGVQLRRESSTRTVWPAADLPLGDRLNDHLRKSGANLRNFPEALPPEPRYLPNEPRYLPNEPALMAPAAGTDDRALPAPAAGTDGPAMLAALVTALQQAQPPAPHLPPDPLAVARALGDAAALGAWLTTAEVAQLLRVSPGTVRSWGDGHQPRPGFRLDRRREGPTVWWRVTAVTS